MKNEYQIITKPCNYCKQTTTHLVRPTKSVIRPGNLVYMFICENCGFSITSSEAEYNKYKNTEEKIDIGRVGKILDKSKQLHLSEEFKKKIEESDNKSGKLVQKLFKQPNSAANWGMGLALLSLASSMFFNKIPFLGQLVYLYASGFAVLAIIVSIVALRKYNGTGKVKAGLGLILGLLLTGYYIFG